MIAVTNLREWMVLFVVAITGGALYDGCRIMWLIVTRRMTPLAWGVFVLLVGVGIDAFVIGSIVVNMASIPSTVDAIWYTVGLGCEAVGAFGLAFVIGHLIREAA